ncbi:MAG: T9SS type A sorting domain-containing protein [Ignavibacteriae bacterium]|nr:T9SS type A sorting domain-containing protein [Ignavibacteriota bacterium]
MKHTFSKYFEISTLYVLLCTFFFGELEGGSPKKKSVFVGVGQSFRIYPSAIVQTEPVIARHPLNQNILFVSANTFNLNSGFQSEGVYSTTDGGANWLGNDTCRGFLITDHRGNPGIAIDKNGGFIITRLGVSPGLYSHYSTNNGLNWSTFKTITTEDLYKATLTSDGGLTSNYFGRTYAVWTLLSAQPFPTVFSYTDDGGLNWSSPIQINNPANGKIGNGGEADIMANGTIGVCWVRANNSSPFTADFVGFALSNDGGTSWTVNENAFDVNGINGYITTKANLRVKDLPHIAIDKSGLSNNNSIYIVTAQKGLSPAGNDPDIILNRSTDSGKTWSSGIRVNQDVLNNGKYQYFPAIHVDDGGGVNVLYYDDRNTTSDSVGVFLSRSIDGGTTWKDFEVSEHNFKPAQIPGMTVGYQGDNIALTSVGNTLHAFWMDNSTGIYQIWSSQIELSALGVDNGSVEIPSEFELSQNFPNPFNPSTNFGFRITNFGFITLKVYNVLGEEVATLVNEKKAAGKYSVQWNAEGLPSGVYFYKLSSKDGVKARKMLYLR